MTTTGLKQLKYNKARLAIMKFIAESGMKVGDHLPPERELVNQLSCSSITMRHALSDMEKAGMIERRHGSGTYLCREIKEEQFQCSILFVFVFRKNEDLPGWGMDRLRRYLADRGIGLSYVAVTEFGLEVLNAAKNCIGIITGGWLTDELIEQLKTLNLPIVVQGNSDLHNDVPAVSADLESAAYRLTKIMQEDGRRKIALFRGLNDYQPAVQAENGYARAMDEAKLAKLIMSSDRLGYNEKIEDFMTEHPDIDGILMEHTTLPDFISWVWRTDYCRKPAIGFLSGEIDQRTYRQSRNFIWLKFENISVKAGQLLLEHVIEGKPLKSIQIIPSVPCIDSHENSFIS